MSPLPIRWRPLADEEPDLWLFVVLRWGTEEGKLGPECLDAFLNEAMRSASRRMEALVLRLPAEEGRRQAIRLSLERASLGLEYLTKAEKSQALTLLRENSFSRLEAEGEALLERVRRRAESVHQSLHLTSPTPFLPVEEIELANAIETFFLDALSRGELALEKVGPRLRKSVSPRPIRTLREVQNAFRMLDALTARVEVFRAFPPERLFARKYEMDLFADTAAVILTRLFVHLVAHGTQQPDFDVSEEDVHRFSELFETERETLTRWIETFVRRHLSPTHQSWGHAYLLASLEGIFEILPFLET